MSGVVRGDVGVLRPRGRLAVEGESGRNELLRGPFALTTVSPSPASDAKPPGRKTHIHTQPPRPLAVPDASSTHFTFNKKESREQDSLLLTNYFTSGVQVQSHEFHGSATLPALCASIFTAVLFSDFHY